MSEVGQFTTEELVKAYQNSQVDSSVYWAAQAMGIARYKGETIESLIAKDKVYMKEIAAELGRRGAIKLING